MRIIQESHSPGQHSPGVPSQRAVWQGHSQDIAPPAQGRCLGRLKLMPKGATTLLGKFLWFLWFWSWKPVVLGLDRGFITSFFLGLNRGFIVSCFDHPPSFHALDTSWGCRSAKGNHGSLSWNRLCTRILRPSFSQTDLFKVPLTKTQGWHVKS